MPNLLSFIGYGRSEDPLPRGLIPLKGWKNMERYTTIFDEHPAQAEEILKLIENYSRRVRQADRTDVHASGSMQMPRVTRAKIHDASGAATAAHMVHPKPYKWEKPLPEKAYSPDTPEGYQPGASTLPPISPQRQKQRDPMGMMNIVSPTPMHIGDAIYGIPPHPGHIPVQQMATMPPMGFSNKSVLHAAKNTRGEEKGALFGLTVLTWNELHTFFLGESINRPESKQFAFVFTTDGGLRIGQQHIALAFSELVLLAGEVTFGEGGVVTKWNRLSGTYLLNEEEVAAILFLRVLPFSKAQYTGTE